MNKDVEIISPGSFEPERHYYTRVLNATIHPMVKSFLSLDPQRLATRFCHLNPRVDPAALNEVLHYQPKFLKWAGADLFSVATASGLRRMVVIETNSCPSGQKSMPLFAEHEEDGGYGRLIKEAFGPIVRTSRVKDGELAVVYDKNYMENSGYAAAMADCFGCDVLLAPFFNSAEDPPVKFDDGVMFVRRPNGDWTPIRAAFRYVTQKPWNRIPIYNKTPLLNPVVACLAGGRNKMVASMAYEIFNAEYNGSGLAIHIPETVRDVHKEEIPFVVQKFGGHAVIKIPYSNAGQGVFIVTNKAQLTEFMQDDYPYNRFIVQSLIGNYRWSSQGALGKFYHLGTVPNKRGELYVADLRMMVYRGDNSFRPIAVYGRRAKNPLSDELGSDCTPWDMLGTNLSVKTGTDSWDTDSSRLVMMDRKDFNSLGIGLDDLILGYVQTVMAVCAVDKMACSLFNSKGKFRSRAFRSLNDDPPLLEELRVE